MKPNISSFGYTPALAHALKALELNGWEYNSDAKILLLPVPSFDSDGTVKGGGILPHLPDDTIIIGGNLHHGNLGSYKTLDLLQDPEYLWKNAAITAHCAVCIAMQKLPVILDQCPVLVAGWGRIGKCLARLLRLLGARVTVAARKETDRAMAAALGYHTADLNAAAWDLSEFRVIFNTVPAMVFPACRLKSSRADCLLIDLASVPGIESPKVIWARGLPNRDAPESSGQLIAQIVEREFCI